MSCGATLQKHGDICVLIILDICEQKNSYFEKYI